MQARLASDVAANDLGHGLFVGRRHVEQAGFALTLDKRHDDTVCWRPGEIIFMIKCPYCQLAAIFGAFKGKGEGVSGSRVQSSKRVGNGAMV